MKLIKKHTYKGTITLETGLHIGGSKSTLDIGGLDSPVIKTAKGIPYIPGSSLKGKLRSLLALKEKATDINKESENLLKLFGSSEKDKEQKTRLIFRDALLNTDKFKEIFNNSELLIGEYTEEKYENTIDRTTGKTKNGGLRQIERVPAGAVFNFEVILDEYDVDSDNIETFKSTLEKGFDILKKDYLGGSGTRGYGQVSIKADWEEESFEI